MSTDKESKAMREVWEWKAQAIKKFEHLSVSEALHQRLLELLEAEKQRKTIPSPGKKKP